MTTRPPDPQQCEEIFRIARGAALRMGATPTDAEEIGQITAFKLWRARDTPHVTTARARSAKSWAGYIRATGRNAYRDLLRSQVRRQDRERLFAFDERGAPMPQRPGAAPAPRADKRSELERLEVRWFVNELIDEHLTGRPRTVARLIFLDGASVQEAATELGLSNRVVRSERQKAIGILQRRLGTSTD